MNTVTACVKCGERNTRHPSGVCARCRRVADIPVQLCKCCEQRRTRDESGLCYLCRNTAAKRGNGVNRIDEAVSRYEAALNILKLKAQGASFRDIAAELDMPKSTVARIFSEAVFSTSFGIDLGGSFEAGEAADAGFDV